MNNTPEVKTWEQRFDEKFTHKEMWGTQEMVYLTEGSPDNVKAFIAQVAEESEAEGRREKIEFIHLQEYVKAHEAGRNEFKKELLGILEMKKESALIAVEDIRKLKGSGNSYGAGDAYGTYLATKEITDLISNL